MNRHQADHVRAKITAAHPHLVDRTEDTGPDDDQIVHFTFDTPEVNTSSLCPCGITITRSG